MIPDHFGPIPCIFIYKNAFVFFLVLPISVDCGGIQYIRKNAWCAQLTDFYIKKKKPYPPIQFVRIFVYSIRALLLVVLKIKSYITIFSTTKIKIEAPLVEPKPLYYQSVWIVDCGGIQYITRNAWFVQLTYFYIKKKKNPYPPIQLVRIFVYFIRALLLVVLKSHIAIFSKIEKIKDVMNWELQKLQVFWQSDIWREMKALESREVPLPQRFHGADFRTDRLFHFSKSEWQSNE